tara:strand:+ start:3330 stop:4358 length:1029 start_codon:yes stop_codon:yes gene_type:complete
MNKEITLHNSSEFQNSTIIDRFGRVFNYLRIAINERCNLRCIYCMPEEGILFQEKDTLLDKNEICKIIKLTSELGVSKIRFTGGEPLLRNDLLDLIKYTYQQTNISSIHLTTNGVLLSKYINQLVKAGLDGINISLDTLDKEKFKKITRREELEKVLEGLDLAISSRIKSIKVNIVAMRDFNDNEIIDFVELTRYNDITVRFIELMPFDSHQIWKTGKFYKADQIVHDLKSHYNTLKPVTGSSTEYYIFKIKEYAGRVAVIPSYTRSLCSACNRIRVTADGNLLNCLYSRSETNMRDAIRNGMKDEDLKKLIVGSMQKKLKDGLIAQNQGNDSRESMTQIGG